MKYKTLISSAAVILSVSLLAACGAQPTSTPSASEPASSNSLSSTPAQSAAEAVYHKITAEEAHDRLAKNPDAIVVDVRREDEYLAGHIPGAILVPNETITTGGRPEKLPDLDAELLVHCRTGIRSKDAATKLVALGYTNVYDFGGIQSWPYETVTGPEEESLPNMLTVGEKRLPGCRVDLPYPLKMSGESLATDFSRWSAKDVEGNLVTEEVLKGSKLTLVSVWSSYCGSCVGDLTALQELYAEYDRADLNVIGIVASSQKEDGSIDEGELEIVKQLQEMTGAAFLQMLPSDDLIAIRLKDLDKLPETFLLDSSGKQIGETVIGGRSAEEFRRLVEQGMTAVSGS